MMDWHVITDVVTADRVTAFATVIIAIIGAFFSFISWRQEKRERQAAYLHIEVSADLKYENFLTVMTSVENRGLKPKKLENSVLLIGPEDENPIETMRKICITVQYTDDIVKRSPLGGIKSGPEGRCLIPLRFYYGENVQIADEKVSYRVPISTQDMERGKPYSVRFFIHGEDRFHRSTQDCFILPKGDDG